MPVVQISLISGYDAATKIDLADRLTRAVRATIAAPLDGITILINELEPAGYMRAHRSAHRNPTGTTSADNRPEGTIAPGAPVPDAQQLVKQFLDAMGARDLDQAQSLISHNFKMQFPGSMQFTKLEQLLEWSRTRYSSINKTYDRFESVWQMNQTIVWCYGHLDGQWPDGRPFTEVRFVDRFTVEHDKLIDQTVWNDLAEVYRSA